MTFSIVGRDPETQELGVAVASKFLAVGSVVPWAHAGVGAVATQSYANTTFGPVGLTLMSQGYSAEDALQGILAADAERAERQVGLVDARGGTATYTGAACHEWAGGRTGPNYTAQGNILVGANVVDAMASAFESATGGLADRLLAALRAGDTAGGDRRGRQSAALLVVQPGGGYAGFNDRAIDLRADDHPQPVDELFRLLDMHRLYMTPTRAEDLLPIDDRLAETIQQIMLTAAVREEPPGPWDERAHKQLWQLFGIENLEGRWSDDTEIDRVALRYLGQRYGVDVEPA